MKKIWLFAISAVIGCGAFIASGLPLYAQTKGAPVPFSADWGYYDEGERRNGGTYYAGPDAVRVERTADGAVFHVGPEGGPYATIYNLKDTVTWVLDHTECTYMKHGSINWSHFFCHFGSPCPKDTRARRIGRDTLQGRSVEKWRCTFPEKHHIVVWYDTRLQTPIRIYKDPEFDEYFELSNITEGPQPETLFIPPPGWVTPVVARHIEGGYSCPE